MQVKIEQKEIGNRLKEIRKIFNNGYKCSLEQFADILGESKFNISNYEQGKANIPNRTMNSLYLNGINPIYIISGEGDKFAPNQKGRELKEYCDSNDTQNEFAGDLIDNSEFRNLSVDELIAKADKYQSAAGNILKLLYERKIGK